jgi:hypothetical protein
LGVVAALLGAMVLVACGDKPPVASKQVQDRADVLLDPIVAWCRGRPTDQAAKRAAFDTAVDPFIALALRHADEIYPSFLSESQDVTFAQLLQSWAKDCRYRGGSALRLGAAARKL